MEFILGIICGLVPFFFCLILHIHNFEGKDSMSVEEFTNTVNEDEKSDERPSNRSHSVLELQHIHRSSRAPSHDMKSLHLIDVKNDAKDRDWQDNLSDSNRLNERLLGDNL